LSKLYWGLFSPTRLAVVLLIVMGAVYFYGLTTTGMISADEPRYAAIGRAMAQTGDWVTPRLWGKPWFEKPPFVYWTTALATKAGLGLEAAPRLPVALLGFGFVVFFYFLIRHEFGPAEALYATCVLGTSALWFAYSFVAVTDIPMSVFFCSALLLSLEWVSGGKGSVARAVVVGALLGFAVLAKGLVPMVLFAPVVWPMRRRLAHLALIGGACLMVAAPWYVECTLRNGPAFVNDFIWKQHFERFFTPSLQHVQKFWFYVPVLLGGVFPWTPLIALLRPGLFRDARLRFLGLWLLFAFAFFSIAKNKLPGYLIPLLPAACLILGIALGWARRTRIPLFLCALSLAVTPMVVAVLPDALDVGLSHAGWKGFDIRFAAALVLLSIGPLWLEIRSWRTEALALATLLACVALLYVKVAALPSTDRVRPFYRQHANWLDSVCLHDVDRDARYQLQYYAGREFPICQGEEATPKIMEVGPRLILLD
jgi:4-amino-4-deoxy-L-arabinose transferase-like glycosyltransferase